VKNLKVRVLELLSNGYLASGSDDNTVKLWNTTSGTAIGVSMNPFGDSITCLKQMTDGSLAIGGYASSVFYYNITQQSQISKANNLINNKCLACLLYNNSMLVVADYSTSRVLNPAKSTSLTQSSQFSAATSNILCYEQLGYYLY
jgi:WD40 repeat protein